VTNLYHDNLQNRILNLIDDAIDARRSPGRFSTFRVLSARDVCLRGANKEAGCYTCLF
jgi:hypothetical protein